MNSIDPFVKAYLSGLVRNTIWVPDRISVPEGLRCAHCSYTVKTKSKQAHSNASVANKLKIAENHDEHCTWRREAEAKEALADKLLAYGNPDKLLAYGNPDIGLADLVHILPDAILAQAAALGQTEKR